MYRLLCLFALFALPVTPLAAQDCPGDNPLQNHDGTGQVTCPCFIVGEEAGVVLEAPADHYPIEILSISITWASQFGSAPQSLEQALHLYAGGLPDPGTPIFTLPGPVMTDGFINQFDIELIPGDKTIASGPFTVTLEFANENAGNLFAASVVHDGNGCQAGKNVIKAIPGGWGDACAAGVTGDWVMSVVYRCSTPTDAGDYSLKSATGLFGVTPNPFVSQSRIGFALQQPGQATLRVFDVRGRVVATLADRRFGSGQHSVTWQGKDDGGTRVAPGTYLLRFDTGDGSFTRKIVLRK
jgi:hypothetical protein